MGNIISISTENYIKAIYKLEREEDSGTRPGFIAKELGITNAAATDMARKLASKKLIDYKKYKGIRLTSTGKKKALSVIRKHRLWETFLHQVFDLTMHEIHREAEILEHSTSDFMAEKLNHFLGNPALDPHGDPIPDKDGIIVKNDNYVALSLAEAGKEYEICRLSGSDKEFFDFCNSNQLKVGEKLSVKRQYSKNKMTEVEINQVKLLLNTEFSNTIYVK